MWRRPAALAVGAGEDRPATTIADAERSAQLVGLAARTLLFVVAAGMTSLVAGGALARTGGPFDFHTYYLAGQAVLAGHSPYPAADPRVLAGQDQFVYPAPAALLAAVFALVPLAVAAFVFEVGAIVAAIASLWIVGERRAVALAFAAVSPVILNAVNMGTVMPFLMLLAACAWRYRDRPWAGGLAVCGLIALKLFLWPLVLFLLCRRSYRAALIAAAGSAAVIVCSWAALGFAGMATYPQLLGTLAQVEGHLTFATGQLVVAAGGNETAGKLLSLAVTGVLLAAAVRLRADAAGCFALCVCAGLTSSPIVWLNYAGCVMVAVAVLRPRHVVLWALPCVFWVLPQSQPHGQIGYLLLFHVGLAVMLAVAWRSRQQASEAAVVRPTFALPARPALRAARQLLSV